MVVATLRGAGVDERVDECVGAGVLAAAVAAVAAAAAVAAVAAAGAERPAAPVACRGT